MLPDEPEFCASHATPLIGFDYGKNRFVFSNSWGREWGDAGFGYLPYENFDQSIIEAWRTPCSGLYPPVENKEGIICLEWKWSLNSSNEVHGREIVDASTLERIAWAFCVRRGQFLDVDELFVWPDERGRGYGRRLAAMVQDLAHALNCPLRMWVSFADAEPGNLELTNVASRLLGLRLSPSPVRWADQVALETPLDVPPRTWRPQRPSSILEWLRPVKEAPVDEPAQVRLFFGTNRKPKDANDMSTGFSGSRDEQLHLGFCDVSIPRGHRFGAAAKSWLQLWKRGHGDSLSLKEIQGTSDEDFVKAAGSMLTRFGEEPQNLLYVHGYRVPFEDAALRAAQLTYDLKIPGLSFFYSWPSAGRLRSYPADEAAIDASLPYLESFLRLVLREFEGIPLNIIVHSMGSRAVLRILEKLAADGFDESLGQVIFAAPDEDRSVFTNKISSFTHMCKRISLYATCADWALQASEWLHGFTRAGLAPPITICPDVDSIVVEGFDLLSLGHNYYAEAAPLLHDIFYLLHHDAPPQDRPRTRHAVTPEGESYWRIPIG
jgi:esterase/lipase superfamily enzyme/GNAT superfamily N-acetyltransferase